MMPLRLDGYVRVSRVGGRAGEGYISPDVQREAIETYARELGGEIVAWHDDQDYSGGNTERPGFQAMLARLVRGETDGIVVMRIDRFARSTSDGYQIIRDIIDRGQIFASCHERIDPSTPEGKFMLRAFLSHGELFLDQIKASWWTAKSRAVARGVHIGPTPVGYRREKSKPLEPHPVYGPAVTELFARAASRRMPDTELARWMTRRAPRETGAPWQPSEIRRWLRNRVYLGEVRYGGLVNSEAHPPLTDAETWQRAQREPGTQRRAPERFLLSGLVRCANCRYAMGGFNHGGVGNTPVYRCSRARARGCDEASVITAARLEEYVLGLVAEHLGAMRIEAVSDREDLAAAERELAEAEEELAAFVGDLEARRLMGDELWRQGLAARTADRDAKRERRDAIRARLEASMLDVDFGSLERHQLRRLLEGLIRVIFVRRRPRGAPVSDRVLVVWNDDPRAIDLPRPHHGGPFEPYRW